MQLCRWEGSARLFFGHVQTRLRQ